MRMFCTKGQVFYNYTNDNSANVDDERRSKILVQRKGARNKSDYLSR